MEYPIDIVIPWVDGNDPVWIEQFNKYNPGNKVLIPDEKLSDASRFRDYGLLKYWFRGIEKYASWVNKVHFITCGQKPDWLNLNNPKLNWVKHSDYILPEYLPVFSSHPIELFMHKINGLAEHFIYFNDDFFLTDFISPDYFFKNGLPCDYAFLAALDFLNSGIPHIYMNDLIVLNKHFNKGDVIRKNKSKFFSHKYGKRMIRNLLVVNKASFGALATRHFAQPYLKSTLIEVWNNCGDILEKTMAHKFRNQYEDVNQWLFRIWNLYSGNFVPFNATRFEGKYCLQTISENDIEDITSHKYKEICINDDVYKGNGIDCFKEKTDMLLRAFDKMFPEKSDFEI
ncbi:MAG: stealth family protein [Spirochaetia bacterium]|nr:stealth family protein [Spirochaetia bacterium]